MPEPFEPPCRAGRSVRPHDALAAAVGPCATVPASPTALALSGQLPAELRPSRTLCLRPALLDRLIDAWHDPVELARTIERALHDATGACLPPEIAQELAALQAYHARQRRLAAQWATARTGATADV